MRRVLAKDPERRFQTATDLKAALLWAMQQPASPPKAPRASRWRVASASMDILAVGLVAGWALAGRRAPIEAPRPMRFEILPPQNARFVFGTNTGGLALSPDGRALAFVASVGGKSGVWVRRLDETAPRLLPGIEGASYTFWAPDGTSVGFVSGATLNRIGLDGTLPIAVCRVSGLRGASWLSSGDILFGAVSFPLRRVPSAGGTPAPLTALDQAGNEAFHGFLKRSATAGSSTTPEPRTRRSPGSTSPR